MQNLVLSVLLWSLPCVAGLTWEQSSAVSLLRTHCRACHQVGVNRFLVTSDDEKQWNYLFELPTDRSLSNWADRITVVLKWPTEDPKNLTERNPPLSRWMPVGIERYRLAEKTIVAEPARNFLLRVLNDRALNCPNSFESEY